jgi:hypothetical protein
MAEYIKWRLSAAKLSVSMAFLALVGGLAAKTGVARSTSGRSVASRPDKWLPVLDFKGVSIAIEKDFQAIEKTIAKVYDKEQKAISAVEVKFRGYYTRQQANQTFYEKGATVANSGELGGIPASRFVQGNGHVSTGAVSGMGDGSVRKTLLSVPGTNGEIIVVCQPAPVGQPSGIQVLIHNGTSQGVPAVQDGLARTLTAGGDTLLTTISGNTPEQVQLQTFPTSSLSQVMTLTVSGEPTPGGVSVVGQMLNGAG